MAVIKHNLKNQYTVINHQILVDTRLSIKNIGLLVKLISLPEDWNFSEMGLCAIMPNDGRSAIRANLKQLEQYGYLKRYQMRLADGTMGEAIWEITDDPAKEPLCENQISANQMSEKDIQYNINKYNINKHRLIDRLYTHAHARVLKEESDENFEDFFADYKIDNPADSNIVDLIRDICAADDAYDSVMQSVKINKQKFIERTAMIDYDVLSYIISCYKAATQSAPVKNILGYLIKTIYNAPLTCEQAMVNDLHSKNILH